MFHPDVKENPVVIISIAGPFRKGKSFLLGFFLKYLETQSKVIIDQFMRNMSCLCFMDSFSYVVGCHNAGRLGKYMGNLVSCVDCNI